MQLCLFLPGLATCLRIESSHFCRLSMFEKHQDSSLIDSIAFAQCCYECIFASWLLSWKNKTEWSAQENISGIQPLWSKITAQQRQPSPFPDLSEQGLFYQLRRVGTMWDVNFILTMIKCPLLPAAVQQFSTMIRFCIIIQHTPVHGFHGIGLFFPSFLCAGQWSIFTLCTF